MIPGGYILLARKVIDSDLMNKPAHYLKLWVWMLSKANWKDRDKLKRGQFVTTISEMQEAGGYKIGYRTRSLTKDEVRSAYEAFTKATMITTTKTTRGMIVTIQNYDLYQNPKNYEPHDEPHNEDTAKPTPTPHDTEEREERKKETITRRTKKRAPSGDHQRFLHYWQAVWRYEFGEEYIITGKDHTHVKTCLKTLGLRASMGKAASFITSEDRFLKGKKDIAMMVSMINRIELPSDEQEERLFEAGLVPPKGALEDWDFWTKEEDDED